MGKFHAPSIDFDLCASLRDVVGCPVPAKTTARANFRYNVHMLSPAGRATTVVTIVDKDGDESSCITSEIDVVRHLLEQQRQRAVKTLGIYQNAHEIDEDRNL